MKIIIKKSKQFLKIGRQILLSLLFYTNWLIFFKVKSEFILFDFRNIKKILIHIYFLFIQLI